MYPYEAITYQQYAAGFAKNARACIQRATSDLRMNKRQRAELLARAVYWQKQSALDYTAARIRMGIE